MNTGDLTLNELIDLRRGLEDRIAQDISQSLQAFKRATGLSASAVNVYLSNSTAFSDRYPEFILERVSVELALE
jgi:hypothetical protein